MRGTAELPLARALRPHGIDLSFTGGGTLSLGVKLADAKSGEGAKIATVFSGGAAEDAGLSAHDVIVAIDGLRVTHAGQPRRRARPPRGNSLAGRCLNPRDRTAP